MLLEKFAHKTDIKFLTAGSPFESFTPCGIDVGYSAIKVRSPFNTSIIPSLVQRVVVDSPLFVDDMDIRYRNENGEIWYVGSLAKKSLRHNVSVKNSIMLGRQRIQSEEFLVQIRVGIFFAMLKNLTDNAYFMESKPLKIQSGLPPEFMKQDSAELKNRFIGEHNFFIKIGKRNWQKVSVIIKPNDVFVCKQPFGTLMSCIMNDKGEVVNEKLLTQNLLVVDPGFHSVDTFHCLQGATEGESLTWENYGMQEVFQRTCNSILKGTKNQADINVYMLEKSLKDGFVYYGPKKQKYDFTNDFYQNLRNVCRSFLNELDTTYNNMMDVDVIIVTGGTGAAWEKYIREHYSQMGGLQVVLANKDNDIVLANVEGYYNLLVSRFM